MPLGGCVKLDPAFVTYLAETLATPSGRHRCARVRTLLAGLDASMADLAREAEQRTARAYAAVGLRYPHDVLPVPSCRGAANHRPGVGALRETDRRPLKSAEVIQGAPASEGLL